MQAVEYNATGIYYFLGNITSHITHVLPLYKALGGTVVVTSEKARKRIEDYGVPAIAIDDRPYKWMRPGRRPQRIHEYAVMDARLKKTYDFLDSHAKVILFYDLFDIERPEWLTHPKKIFMHHGNGLKPFFTMQPKRRAIMNRYDFIGSLSPYMRQYFLDNGISAEKLVDIGIARTDEIAVAKKQSRSIRESVATSLSLDPNKTIVLYAPTFWGDSSVYTTGLEIMKSIPSHYQLLFRPHPQTPQKIKQKYYHLAEEKQDIRIIEESATQIDLVSLLAMSDVIIADLSSVVLEAILLDTPIIFAYSSDDYSERANEYHQIREIVDYSQKVSPATAKNIDTIIHTAIRRGIDQHGWRAVQERTWFYPTSGSVNAIKKFITKLL